MRVFAAIFLMLMAAAARADTGNELYSKCNATTGEQLYCMGYIVGIATYLRDYGKVCVPDGVTKQQVVDVVMLQLANYPAGRHMDAYMIIYAALLAGFPCK